MSAEIKAIQWEHSPNHLPLMSYKYIILHLIDGCKKKVSFIQVKLVKIGLKVYKFPCFW